MRVIHRRESGDDHDLKGELQRLFAGCQVAWIPPSSPFLRELGLERTGDILAIDDHHHTCTAIPSDAHALFTMPNLESVMVTKQTPSLLHRRIEPFLKKNPELAKSLVEDHSGDQPIVWNLWSPHLCVFEDLIAVLHHEITGFGKQSIIRTSFEEVISLPPGSLLIVVGEPIQYGWHRFRHLRIILWQWEQPGNSMLWRPADWKVMDEESCLVGLWFFSPWLLDQAKAHVTFAKARCSTVHYCWSPIERFIPPTPEDDEQSDKEIDVLFIGEVHRRRTEAIAAIRQKCPPGTRIRWVQGGVWDWPSRKKLCVASKIVVNISYYAPASALEVHRIVPALCWNCCVISEMSSDALLDTMFSQDFEMTICPFEELATEVASALADGTWKMKGRRSGQLFRQGRHRHLMASEMQRELETIEAEIKSADTKKKAMPQ